MPVKPAPNQLPIDWNPPRARRSDPKTSKAAANINPTGIRLEILWALFYAETPLASFQIAESMNIPRDSVSPHMKPLLQAGFIEKTGQTVVNPKTRRKTESETYRLTGKGRELSAISSPL